MEAQAARQAQHRRWRRDIRPVHPSQASRQAGLPRRPDPGSELSLCAGAERLSSEFPQQREWQHRQRQVIARSCGSAPLRKEPVRSRPGRQSRAPIIGCCMPANCPHVQLEFPVRGAAGSYRSDEISDSWMESNDTSKKIRSAKSEFVWKSPARDHDRCQKTGSANYRLIRQRQAYVPQVPQAVHQQADPPPSRLFLSCARVSSYGNTSLPEPRRRRLGRCALRDRQAAFRRSPTLLLPAWCFSGAIRCVIEANDVGRQRQAHLAVMRAGRDTATVLRAVLGRSLRCMDIPSNLLFARWRPDGRLLGTPDGAAREITNSENNEARHAVGIAAPAPRFRAQPEATTPTRFAASSSSA